MTAVARDFYILRAGGLAVVAAILLIVRHQAITGGVLTLFCLVSSHVTLLHA
jgi:hypothetical protein